MNKFWLITFGVIAAIVALSNIGPMIGLAVSGLIIYMGVHFYLGSMSTAKKVWWAFVGIVGAISAISNVPALIGVAAVAVLWMIYRKWNDKPVEVFAETNDPFTNFEKQWNKLSKQEEYK
ncbi:ABC transporter permease [Planococcus sp. N028]|uniref:ABC transporter permease n=1 Tax=Planococcus shixiaomingii TaxID=3058393 RepID=A0ABT8N1Z2_9BACL|nr:MULTISPECIES: ABC transporter permease [unclassified Planococcus (in: firmicutes)]MDN7241906.1 ABC transporter permease [Planococcus sp. N028]WKA54191.1 ABC transporter permease [Planococcus sp. N022]